MGFLSWIVFGALAGWLASMVTGNNKEMGLLSNIVVGIVGASIGGFIFNQFGASGVQGFNIQSLLVAIVGAVVLLFILNLFTKKR